MLKRTKIGWVWRSNMHVEAASKWSKSVAVLLGEGHAYLIRRK
jgi:hypothetical protein